MAWILLYKSNVNDIINVWFGGIINENFIGLCSWNVYKFSKEKNCCCFWSRRRRMDNK
nr:MAG TPA_asm: hypothetical protein [Caudoviricetes sp.]